MQLRKHARLHIFVMPTLLVIAMLSLATVGEAQTALIAGVMEGNLPIHPGDTVQAGYDFSLPPGQPATTIAVSGGSVVIPVICPNNSIQNITINFPSQNYAVSANNTSWVPSAASNLYQASTVAPSTLCGGKTGYAQNGATFTASFACQNKCVSANARFHYCDKSAGNWSPAESCIPPKKCISEPCKCQE